MVETDAATIASIRARQHGTVSTRPNAPPVEMRSALRVEDVTFLLGLVDRQREQLAATCDAIGYVAAFLEFGYIPTLEIWNSDDWVLLTRQGKAGAMAAAIRELAEEVRRGTGVRPGGHGWDVARG
jgi:hypothetical protein